MPAKPWITLRPPDPEREYLVLLTALPLQRLRDLDAFLLYTWRILDQLRRTPDVEAPELVAVDATDRLLLDEAAGDVAAHPSDVVWTGNTVEHLEQFRPEGLCS